MTAAEEIKRVRTSLRYVKGSMFYVPPPAILDELND
jgi:hypothetical protein